MPPISTGISWLIPLVVAVSVILLLWALVLFFNRNPDRLIPDDSQAILSPADGVVTLIEQVKHPHEHTHEVWRIVIFLSLWDVHVQRAPVAGRVCLSRVQAGGNLPALFSGAAHNAGHWLEIESPQGNILVLRSAGLIARRVITTVALDQTLAAGQQIGRILLGSRAEVFLPTDAALAVKQGNRVIAGETIIAKCSRHD
jgi:phosphatidylserine decarboxylase